MADKKPITAQERNENFKKATRQNKMMIGTQVANRGGVNLDFDLPKARFLSSLFMRLDAKVKIAHPTKTTVPMDSFTPYKILDRLSLDVNVGFNPYVIEGKSIAMYNCLRLNPNIIFPQSTNKQGFCYCPDFKASPEGAENAFSFSINMPITLNERDMVGMLLLQNNETNVKVTATITQGNGLLDFAQDYVVTIENVKMSMCAETFSVPAVQQAFPDISILKLVHSRQEAFSGSGINVVKLTTGGIYRKLILYITDTDGVPFADTDLTGDIELVFNQSDTNYKIDPAILRSMNEYELGYPLPMGMYVFDFSNNGLPNLGGTRDLINTNKLTEFWIRFPSIKRGNVLITTEVLSELVSN